MENKMKNNDAVLKKYLMDDEQWFLNNMEAMEKDMGYDEIINRLCHELAAKDEKLN